MLILSRKYVVTNLTKLRVYSWQFRKLSLCFCASILVLVCIKNPYYNYSENSATMCIQSQHQPSTACDSYMYLCSEGAGCSTGCNAPGGGRVGQDHVLQLLLMLHLFHYRISIENRNTWLHQTVVYFKLFWSCVRSTSYILVEILLCHAAPGCYHA